jgi:predicted RNase H-like nuclease (RuvC/YqgF family)
MEIKKETPKIEYLDYKVYQKIINQLTSTNEIIKKMKEKSFQLSNNINDTNKDNKKSTETLNDIIEPKEELISKIKSENEQYKKEINSIKTKNSELEKNYEELKQKYEKEIKEKDDKIISMQKDIDDITKKYNELNEQMLQEKKIENKNLAIETILNEDKLVEKIINFLPIEDSLKYIL